MIIIMGVARGRNPRVPPSPRTEPSDRALSRKIIILIISIIIIIIIIIRLLLIIIIKNNNNKNDIIIITATTTTTNNNNNNNNFGARPPAWRSFTPLGSGRFPRAYFANLARDPTRELRSNNNNNNNNNKKTTSSSNNTNSSNNNNNNNYACVPPRGEIARVRVANGYSSKGGAVGGGCSGWGWYYIITQPIT